MKRINLITSALILAQGLYFTTNTSAVPTSIVDASRDESASPISAPKPLIAAFKYVRPKTADNGSPFPKKSGYVKGYPIQVKSGLSSLTVNNSKNSSDVFVKLYALDSVPPQPVRVFFIRKGEKFTTSNIKAGNYDVRHRDLNYGGLSRTETFELKQYTTAKGTRFSQMSLTLYKVPNGNLKTYPLSEQEF